MNLVGLSRQVECQTRWPGGQIGWLGTNRPVPTVCLPTINISSKCWISVPCIEYFYKRYKRLNYDATVISLFTLASCRPNVFYYRPQRSWGKVMFLQVCVILFTGGSTWPGIPPGTRCTPRDQVQPPRTRCTPRDRLHTPQDQLHTPRDQVHPPGPGTPPRLGTPPGTRYTPQTSYTPPGPGTPPRPGTPPQDQVHTPQDQLHPPRPGTPPSIRYTPQDQVQPPRTRYTPPGPGRYGLRAGGTHPTGMQSYLFQMG